MVHCGLGEKNESGKMARTSLRGKGGRNRFPEGSPGLVRPPLRARVREAPRPDGSDEINNPIRLSRAFEGIGSKSEPSTHSTVGGGEKVNAAASGDDRQHTALLPA